MRLLHTADWQIGKVFRFVAPEKMALLQQTRLDAIERLADAAQAHGASIVLVAGDVFDFEGVSERTLRQPLERMRARATLAWHLIPGNHDAHRPNGLWDRVRGHLPANVHVHLERRPVDLGDGVWLLPCPLQTRHTLTDPTEWTEAAETPPGAVRLGLAHGTVRNFGSDPETANLIAADRAERSRLDWLALGDWHGAVHLGRNAAYSGTPEPDGFGQTNSGKALVVEIAAAGTAPAVHEIEIGRYRWLTHDATLAGPDDIDALDAYLQALGPHASSTLLRLTVRGALSFALLERFEQQIRRRGDAALFDLSVNDDALVAEPTDDDLRALDVQGPVGAVAQNLRAAIAGPDPATAALARQALRRLYLEYRIAEGAA